MRERRRVLLRGRVRLHLNIHTWGGGLAIGRVTRFAESGHWLKLWLKSSYMITRTTKLLACDWLWCKVCIKSPCTVHSTAGADRSARTFDTNFILWHWQMYEPRVLPFILHISKIKYIEAFIYPRVTWLLLSAVLTKRYLVTHDSSLKSDMSILSMWVGVKHSGAARDFLPPPCLFREPSGTLLCIRIKRRFLFCSAHPYFPLSFSLSLASNAAFYSSRSI